MIYFNQDMEACAFPVDNAMATVDDAVWSQYCMDARGTTWDIKDGRFVQLKDADYVKKRQDAERRIRELKSMLNNTDYQSIKHSEGLISDEDWEPIYQNRVAWRKEINELEEEYGL